MSAAEKTWKFEPGQDAPKREAANDNSPVLAIVQAFDFREEDIPPRDWIVPGVLIRGHVSLLVAPPGAGKSLFTLQLTTAAARGLAWGGFTPRDSYRALVINSEDDVDEMRRRLAATLRMMDVTKSSVIDKVFLADRPDKIVVAKTDPKTKTVTRQPLVDEIIKLVQDNAIDVLVVDPFAETFEGDENNNAEIKWAATFWREVARKAHCSVFLVHHTSKALSGAPGDMNAARGGGSLVGVARVMVTLFAMSEADAKAFGMSPDDRHLYVRFDDAKANLSLVTGQAKWFRKETVRLNNGTVDRPADEVGVFIPWTPQNLMDGISTATANAILDEIATGMLDGDGKPNGSRYCFTDSRRGARWAGHIVIRHHEMPIERATRILKAWLENEVIVESDYHDPFQNKAKKGLKVVDANRPGRIVT